VQTTPAISQAIPGSTILPQGESIVPGSYQRVQPNLNLPRSVIQGEYVPSAQQSPPVGSLESIVNSQQQPTRHSVVEAVPNQVGLVQDLAKAKALISKLEATIVELRTSLDDQESAKSSLTESDARVVLLEKKVAHLEAELAHLSARKQEQVAKLTATIDSMSEQLAMERTRSEKMKAELAIGIRNARERSRIAQETLEKLTRDRVSERELNETLAASRERNEMARKELQKKTEEADVARIEMKRNVAELTEVLNRERQIRVQLETKLAEAIQERKIFSDKLAEVSKGAAGNDTRASKAKSPSQKEKMLAEVEKRLDETSKNLDKKRAELNEQLADLKKQAAALARQAKEEKQPANRKSKSKKSESKKSGSMKTDARNQTQSQSNKARGSQSTTRKPRLRGWKRHVIYKSAQSSNELAKEWKRK
jgi:hypothetical protein